MVAPCGTVCTECAIYRAAQDPKAAECLAREWRAGGLPNARADWFRCQGCHGDPACLWTEDCRIRRCCVEEKRLTDCSHCEQFPCQTILGFEADGEVHHRAAVANLRRMRELRA